MVGQRFEGSDGRIGSRQRVKDVYISVYVHLFAVSLCKCIVNVFASVFLSAFDATVNVA